MGRRPASFSRVAQPVRTLWQRFAFTALVLAAFGLMLLGKADIVMVKRVQVAAVDAMAPILEALSHPAAAVSKGVSTVVSLRDLHAENERLREENSRLKQWQHVANLLESENKALKRLTRHVGPPPASYISARIIAEAGGAFVRSALLNVGRRNGVRRGQAVISEDGLAGTIVEVGELHARMLLITDLNAQIPVLLGAARDPGIMVGDNTNLTRVLYLPQNSVVSPGDLVISSGHGGMMPAGIPVGTVSAVTESGIRIKPVVDWTHLEFVKVVDYRMQGVIPGPMDPPPFTVLAPDPEPSLVERLGVTRGKTER
ncbi:rod shape-determining protein MreC [Nisaea sp.]|uniref:rod shape-determining protein MreC n=1 Tax=Nisaea sp. TaxID=2024842 RepID=UPI003B53034E